MANQIYGGESKFCGQHKICFYIIFGLLLKWTHHLQVCLKNYRFFFLSQLCYQTNMKYHLNIFADPPFFLTQDVGMTFQNSCLYIVTYPHFLIFYTALLFQWDNLPTAAIPRLIPADTGMSWGLQGSGLSLGPPAWLAPSLSGQF